MKTPIRNSVLLPFLSLAICTGFAFAAEKPVKVYILSGQSNMVGIGQVGPMGATRMNTYVSTDADAEAGSILSIYEGEFDPAVDYDKKVPQETHVVRLGYWPHTSFPVIEGPSVSIARGYIRIPRAGEYSFRTTGNSILEIDGKLMYRSVEGEDEAGVRARLDAGYKDPDGFKATRIPATMCTPIATNTTW